MLKMLLFLYYFLVLNRVSMCYLPTFTMQGVGKGSNFLQPGSLNIRLEKSLESVDLRRSGVMRYWHLLNFLRAVSWYDSLVFSFQVVRFEVI